MWKTFATAYGLEPEASRLLYREVSVTDARVSLEDYFIRPAISSSRLWITSLHLGDLECTHSDLIAISSLTNIWALSLGGGLSVSDYDINDLLFRSWARAAEDGSFSMLRLLICRDQRQITTKIFEYLTSFPALAMALFEECPINLRAKRTGEAYGFKVQPGFLRKLNNQEALSASPNLEFLKYLVGDNEDTNATARQSRQLDDIPHLHFSIGCCPPERPGFRANRKWCCFKKSSDQTGEAKSAQRNLSLSSSQVSHTSLRRKPCEEGRPEECISKKPVLRSLKRQEVKHAFVEFGLWQSYDVNDAFLERKRWKQSDLSWLPFLHGLQVFIFCVVRGCIPCCTIQPAPVASPSFSHCWSTLLESSYKSRRLRLTPWAHWYNRPSWG